MIVKMIRETQQLTLTKARSHSRLLISLGVGLSAFLTFCFFSMGIVQADPLYKDMPVFASIPLLAVGSFNAVAFVSLSILFVKSFGEISVSKVKKYQKGRNEKKVETQAKAICTQMDQYGQKDFSLQIDEAKQGLRAEFKEEIDPLKQEVKELKEENLRKDKIINFQNQKIYKTEWENKQLRRENQELKKEKSEKIQTIGDKAQTNVNTENNDFKKFKDLDE